MRSKVTVISALVLALAMAFSASAAVAMPAGPIPVTGRGGK